MFENIVDTYNNTENDTIHIKPNEAVKPSNHFWVVWHLQNATKNNRKYEVLKKGDMVRILFKKETSLINHTNHIGQVENIRLLELIITTCCYTILLNGKCFYVMKSENGFYINLIFINLILLILFLLIPFYFYHFYFYVRAEGEANCCLITVVVAVAAAAALPLPTGSLFGATGWDLESEVVLISGRAPPIE